MKKLNFYTSNEIKPLGWMKRQLEIQAEGLAGNLDKVWKDVKDSMWIGGKAEGWERVPYWLDGFIPLAYLLENDDMISRAKKYVDAIISNQKPSGWICPCNEEEIPTYDTWAVQLITKVLVVYYECSRDERVPNVIYRALKNYYELLLNKTIRLYDWGKYRWFETFVAINFLYKKYKEPWILELAKILKEQGTDYKSLTELWKKPLNQWKYDTHIVNLAMMLKYEVISNEILGRENENDAEYLYQILKKYNGRPTEIFTGDECLSGLSAIQGTELCAVVEQMYSYEHLYAYTSDKAWAERLEIIAFNALPATISDDMWSHQYDQLSNQISCEEFPGKPIFRTNWIESHLFGLEPNYGCCTANFGQGWPKLALSAFMYDEDMVVCSIPIPASLKTEEYSIDLKTNYPFENKFVYSIDARKDFTFKIRIPSFAKKLTLDNNLIDACDELTFEIKSGENKEIILEFETDLEFLECANGLKCVKCGSLIFSLPIEYEKKMREYEKDGVERKFPYCDYEYIGKSDWNYAYSSGELRMERRQVSDIPFSSENPPVIVKAKMKKIDWGYEDGYEALCAKKPESIEPISDEIEATLYPYGCAKLRMTEMPLI